MWEMSVEMDGRQKSPRRIKPGPVAVTPRLLLGVAYQAAWTMAHKPRHGLSEDPARPLRGLLEADETFVGGRGDPTSPGHSTANADKRLVVAAVEKLPAPKDKKRKHGHAVKRQHGFLLEMPGLPGCRRRGTELGAFLKGNAATQSHLLTDGFAGYRGHDAALDEHFNSVHCDGGVPQPERAAQRPSRATIGRRRLHPGAL